MIAVSHQATMALYFHQERQQELLRRKMVGLERILRCKHLVAHVEAHVTRLRSHAQELCGRVDWQGQDDESLRLDLVCSKLRLLSAECESSIDAAMDAILAVSEATAGQEGVLHAQLTKVLRARNAKQHVERLRDQAVGVSLSRARARERDQSPVGGQFVGEFAHFQTMSKEREESNNESAAVCGGGGVGLGGGWGLGGGGNGCEDAGSPGGVREGGGAGLGAGGGGRGGGGGVAMVKELEDGLQVQVLKSSLYSDFLRRNVLEH